MAKKCRRGCGWALGWSARGRAAGAVTVRYTCSPKTGQCVHSRRTAIKLAHIKADTYGTSVKVYKRPRRLK